MKKFKMSAHVMAFIVMLAIPLGLQATPVYDTFGSQPLMDFGGKGIPNDAVAASKLFVGDSFSIEFGLTAHQRYANPALTNDGAGTYFATPGGDVLNGQPDYAKWNVGFDTSLITGSIPTGWYFEFEYDAQSLGPIPIGYADSWNLGMGFLGYTGGFDPDAQQTYVFGLSLYNQNNKVMDYASINVQVGDPVSVPDSGATVAFLGIGMIGLAGVQKLRGKSLPLVS